MDTERKHLLKRLVALVVLSILVHPLGAAEFSKAGYWDAEGSPRRVETLTTGWEFSLDAFKTSKRVTLPHSIDEGESGAAPGSTVKFVPQPSLADKWRFVVQTDGVYAMKKPGFMIIFM